jgi:hypothetical protein
MVVGYNHNIRYKGEVFHVQTEDSGINSPHIITLLYRGGNIIASKKTSYADIVKMGNLNQVVEELMKEQHKDMLRRLKSAEFDAKLGLDGIVETESTTSAPVAVPIPPVMSVPTTSPAPAVAPVQVPSEPAVKAVTPSPLPITDSPKKKQSLDDLIFDFLSAGDDRH